MESSSSSVSLDETVGILNGAIEDIGKLFSLHLELIQAETKKNIGFTKRIVILAFLLTIVVIPTILIFLLGLASLLQAQTSLQNWQALMIVAAVCFIGCLALAYGAQSQVTQLQKKEGNKNE